MNEYDTAQTIMGPGAMPPQGPGMGMQPPMAPGGGAPPGMIPPPPGPPAMDAGAMGGPPMGGPMGTPIPLNPDTPDTQGPYPDVFKFMSSSEGKKVTRAAIDAAVRAATKMGSDIKSKDIVDIIVRTARGKA